jgi:hypothetical protein
VYVHVYEVAIPAVDVRTTGREERRSECYQRVVVARMQATHTHTLATALTPLHVHVRTNIIISEHDQNSSTYFPYARTYNVYLPECLYSS